MIVAFQDLVRSNAPLLDELELVLQDVVRNSGGARANWVDRFEALAGEVLGSPCAAGTSCGTAALSAVFRTLALTSEDEVIVPALTSAASAAAVRLAGGRVVFADVESHTRCLDPADVEARITPRTRAILVVHLHGHSASMDALLDIAARHGVPLIEDAAHAFGASYQGQALGTLGLAGCFSLGPEKPLGALGAAGLVVTASPATDAAVRVLIDHGRLTPDLHEVVGTNEGLDELQAAVLALKIDHFEDWLARRRRVAGWLADELAETDLVLPRPLPGTTSSWYIHAVRTRQRDDLRSWLHAAGIETRLPHPIPCHLQPAFATTAQGPGSLPVAEALARELLALPLHPHLGRDEVAAIGEAVRTFERRTERAVM